MARRIRSCPNMRGSGKPGGEPDRIQPGYGQSPSSQVQAVVIAEGERLATGVVPQADCGAGRNSRTAAKS